MAAYEAIDARDSTEFVYAYYFSIQVKINYLDFTKCFLHFPLSLRFAKFLQFWRLVGLFNNAIETLCIVHRIKINKT